MSIKFPKLPPLVPHRGTTISQNFFKTVYLAQGWEMHGEFPNLPKAVAIVSPHTSNLDAWYGFLALLGLDIKITIFGKHTLFKTPLKPVLEWIGVMPVERNSSHGYTQQIAEIMRKEDRIWIGMMPEGTRKEAEKFRSGFYHIAHEAQIPIVMFALDYQKKVIRILGIYETTGHYEEDLEKILERYKGNFSPRNSKWLAKPLQKLWKKD
ncbi:1-acyl-sn-glycerol-3-phosphate acyltransferase [Acinetobacter equi]|uniref:Acyltransferase n=1 Tax=Acinetobacter equi TaxID=1324350 RepID=A0A0N9VSQ6_9GAMM|nr:1-acyl-sn-glycerol-3-phosphate acyltransferase [Acinetobacter equi]ALH94223.1 acyltransferase [Acinetobacter equi]